MFRNEVLLILGVTLCASCRQEVTCGLLSLLYIHTHTHIYLIHASVFVEREKEILYAKDAKQEVIPLFSNHCR